MTQIGIDKAHLPQVYDDATQNQSHDTPRHDQLLLLPPSVHKVCQCFSVLEDGALAHSLQEQEIDQFYSSNVQKNQAVQNDVRLARRLQDEEDGGLHLTCGIQQMEEQDREYARVIQDELRRRDEQAQRREEEDEEMAKRLQEEEELKIRQERAEAGYHDDRGDSTLSQTLGLWEQMMRDAELARRLQDEEKQPYRRSSETDVDFRTVQVAQDEELARYMQRQEKKSNRRSHDPLDLGRSHDPTATDRRVSRERLNSEGLHSPVEEEQSLDQHPLIQTCTTLHTHSFYNIAEELDPTFTGRNRENRISTDPSSGICLAPRTPHSVFYDYLPEPSLIPPSRRNAGKSGRHKSKEKRESCKQQ